jgi:hypothetical protein
MGTNGLIRAIVAPLGDCLLGNSFGILSKKGFKKILDLKNKYLYYFVKVCVKKLSKIVIFKVFEVHLQLKNNGCKSFYTIFEGPNVNEIISYFGHL